MRGPRWQALQRELEPFVERRVSNAADVDDIVQETLARIHRGLSRLADETRMGPWMMRVARGAIADHYRQAASRARRHEAAADDPTWQAAPMDDVEEEGLAATELLTACVRPFVRDLPALYAEALTLTELDGLSQRDAAARLGVTYATMKSRVQRGRAQLRASIEACCEVELDPRRRIVELRVRRARANPVCHAPGAGEADE